MEWNKTPVLALLFVAAVGAGCLDGGESDGSADLVGPPRLPDVVRLNVRDQLEFLSSIIEPAVYMGDGLYEPTMEVSDSGVIYVTGHTFLVDTTGAPVYMSHDDGATWEQLPWFQDLSMPDPVPGATPPPSDEIFLVAGDDGWLYGVDITLATYPVNAWSDDGRRHAYHNPDAYDEVQAVTRTCALGSVNDRPWADYANGTLLMVNNPGGGPVQVGVMDVPTALPLGGPGIAPITQPTWNLCASPGGSIPGIPALRDDGLFAVPQVERGGGEDELIVVLGNKADVMDTRVVPVTTFSHQYDSGVINAGHAVFDATGSLFVGIMNNTGEWPTADEGRFKLAASADSGDSFVVRTFITGAPVQSVYLDGNPYGTGALLVWAIAGDTNGRTDWYTGHVQLAADGGPSIVNAALVLDEAPPPSAHVSGAAVGPDGRAYFVGFEGAFPLPGETPLRLHVQQDGPRLPVDLPGDPDSVLAP